MQMNHKLFLNWRTVIWWQLSLLRPPNKLLNTFKNGDSSSHLLFLSGLNEKQEAGWQPARQWLPEDHYLPNLPDSSSGCEQKLTKMCCDAHNHWNIWSHWQMCVSGLPWWSNFFDFSTLLSILWIYLLHLITLHIVSKGPVQVYR